MKYKTWAIGAGGLTLAFGLAAGMLMMYPQNRNLAAGLYDSALQTAGLREPPPAAPQPAPRFITAGTDDPAALAFHPGMAASFCDRREGSLLRLSYALALVNDPGKPALLANPRIGGDVETYAVLRRAEIAGIVENRWATQAPALEANGRLDLSRPENAALMRGWLEELAQEIKQQTEIEVALSVNTASAIDRPRSPDCTAPAFRPE